jgi:flagellar biosynthetic protein FliQ
VLTPVQQLPSEPRDDPRGIHHPATVAATGDAPEATPYRNYSANHYQTTRCATTTGSPPRGIIPASPRSRQHHPLPEARPTVSHQLVIDLTRDAIMTALMIALPLLLLALGVGLIVAIFQSVTQIQEQTLTFVPKLVLVGGAFIVGMPWLLQILIKFTTQIIRGIPAMVG